MIDTSMKLNAVRLSLIFAVGAFALFDRVDVRFCGVILILLLALAMIWFGERFSDLTESLQRLTGLKIETPGYFFSLLGWCLLAVWPLMVISLR